MTRVLMVGAGAIGTVYGWVLQQAGAQVDFLVKPAHLASLQNGIQIWKHRWLRKNPTRSELRPHQLLTQTQVASSLAEIDYDVVVITVPSDAIRVGSWLSELAQKLETSSASASVDRPRPIWITMQPGLQDRSWILEHTIIPDARLVSSSIPILSWSTENGTHFWTPPGASTLISHGAAQAQLYWQQHLQRGGFAAKRRPNFREDLLLGDVMLRTLVLALRAHQWSWRELSRSSQSLQNLSEATREAYFIAASIRQLTLSTSPKRSLGILQRLLLSPRVLALLLRLAPHLTPFDLEAFFRQHFTKVATQMDQGTRELLEAGPRLQLSTRAINTLLSDALLRQKLP